VDDRRVEVAGSGTVARLEPLGCALDVEALYASAGG
jgi:hypothetical protein